ncbi:DUF4301 family protein [Marinilabilia salmonicolor]|jgi:hypothetical protein|uniref:Uncharacterized protein DUF4301 n=1 Tax=Marinilabilia salmonicolor TaxID=989 RepID=A0A368VBT3_9BACT|nr:DUF4301 family protein [Marinilabilia salmonicolor]RCW38582.1 uncharacterized protein DUF4301 [Marinilabilia salmonicolor]
MIQEPDLKQLKEKGISVDVLEDQINRFKEGFPPLKAERPATLTNGIIGLSEDSLHTLKELYRKEINQGLTPLKFVPASGAATRMFKALYQFLENPEDLKQLDDQHPAKEFINHLPRFAFFNALKELFPGKNLDNIEERQSLATEIIAKALNEEGLNYGFLPKGLIQFHHYQDGSHTAMLEHLAEAASYAKSREDNAQVHFTVSPEHLEMFKKEFAENIESIQKQTGTTFQVTYSFQKAHTDTVAVLPDNEPFRDEKGNLVFRPGGHGSLIENLNDCDAGIIFIKNIDNVLPSEKIGQVSDYKQALGGLALDIRNKVFDFIRQLEDELSIDLITSIRQFLKETLHTDIPGHLADGSLGEQGAYLLHFLNRPIRVCGMVKNEGEPGGGPFWVRNTDGQETLQIVESSQLDLTDPEQKKIFEGSTHFNPVDLVCITRDFEGNKFDLLQYIDENTGFISEKSINGKSIKALERPGLWNGAMANWLTIFVEVPVDTFNPVKTVNDLLRKAHQPE